MVVEREIKKEKMSKNRNIAPTCAPKTSRPQTFRLSKKVYFDEAMIKGKKPVMKKKKTFDYSNYNSAQTELR